MKNLYYTEHMPINYQGEISDLPVVVLIHGLFGSSDNLSVMRRHLEQFYRVINIDLPDHGKSPWSDHFSFAIYAQQIAQTLKSIDIPNASFVAHSLGGKVAMWLAYTEAQLIEKLIILDIAPVAYDNRHQDVIKGLCSIPLDKITSRKSAQEKLAEFVPELSTQAFLLKSLYENEGKWNWRFNLNVLVDDYQLLSDWSLSNEVVYAKPVLFIKGEKSDYIKAEHQNTIMQQFPKANAKIVNAGHWLHAEKPQIINTLITKYLQSK